MTEDTSQVGRQMAKGATWMVLMRLTRRVIGVVSTVILARLLLPADFGVIILATSLVAILEVMGEFSLDLALISKRDADRRFYDTAWTITILRGVFVAVALIGLSGFAADFFNEPRISEVLYVLSAAAFIDGFKNIGTVDFFKELQLNKNFQMIITSRLISFVVTIALALIWQSYWAMVVGIVVESIARTILSFVLHPYRPRLSLSEWRYIFGFSAWLMLSNVGDFLNNKLDKFIIGRFGGTELVGLYAVAFEISNLPTTNLIAPMQRAIFPGFAKIAHDRERLVANFVDSMALVLMLAVPVGVGIWLTAEPIVRVMLGDSWLGAIPLLQILAIYGVIQITYANSRPIYLALGRPDFVTYTTILQLAVLAPILVYATMRWGAEGAAWAMVGSTAITGSANIVLVGRMLGLSLRRMLRAVWRTVVAAAFMVAGVPAITRLLPLPQGFVGWCASLAAMVTIGALIYVGMHLLLWLISGRPAGAEGHIIAILTERLRRRRAHGRPPAK